MIMNDALKIRAAAFAVRAGHGDAVAEKFVEELCNRGILNRTAHYGEVLEELRARAGWGGSAWAILVNSQGGDEHLKLCEAALVEVQAETRRRCSARIRREAEESPAYRPKWKSGMADAARLIEEGEL